MALSGDSNSTLTPKNIGACSSLKNAETMISIWEMLCVPCECQQPWGIVCVDDMNSKEWDYESSGYTY